jgi:acyl-CoA thioesterase-2
MTGVKSEGSQPGADERSWIARLLDFGRDGDVFVAPNPASGPGNRLFGGLIAAQSLAAAGATVDRPEPGADWQPPVVPAVQFDDSVPKIAGLDFAGRFDIRTTAGDQSVFAVPPFWIRTKDVIEDDPLIRACALTFMSDFGPVPVARPPGTSLNAEGAYAASLDHAVWFHRPFRPEQWHRYEVRSLNNSDARGLVVGSLYDGSGALVASTTQEALWRF